MNIKEFIAKQLNDHSDSQSGVIQKTYSEWTESHIGDAVELGLIYLYSLIPQEFTELNSITIKKKQCVLDLQKICSKFGGIVCITSPDGNKIDVTEKDADTRDLLPLLASNCPANNSDTLTEISYDVSDASKGILLFSDPVPVGTVIHYTCSKTPDLEKLDEKTEYIPLVAEYALWWLFRTDSESRSNLERARLHFEAIRDFVTTKLLIEFSLREDDYNYGRRKVDDT